MRKSGIILTLALVSLLAYALMYVAPNGHSIQSPGDIEGLPSLLFKEGEKFIYEVRYNNIKIGESVLMFNGEASLGDKNVYYISFSTSIPSLKDSETIYADKDTLLPLEVNRTIKKKLGFNDNIKEIYDQKDFRVDITQKSHLRKRGFSIKKDSPIHNAILLIYLYRLKPEYKEGEVLKINLPTTSFDIMFSGMEQIATPSGTYNAYAFTSNPPKFKLWLSADEKRLPLKIENPGTLGYALILRSIEN